MNHTEIFDYQQRIDEIRSALRRASEERWGRTPKIIAVSKTVPAERINPVKDAGILSLGENRVQELMEKYSHLDASFEIDLIGRLQSNKVKYIIDKVHMIQSLDRESLAQEIDRRAQQRGIRMPVLVQVNIGREQQKGGVMPEELASFLGELAHLSSLRLRGLMTIAPKCDEKSDYLKFFAETFQLFLDISQNIAHNNSMAQFDVLSMGMSGSYPEALQCGSTEIRLGSTIFGARA